ncbi:MAG: lysophospholipid acyltransferase family protein [Candidatus Omnitrophota bacterium]
MKAFFRIEVEGRDALPERGPFILAANHVSYFDPPLLGFVMPRRAFFLAKEELFKNRLSRSFFKDLGGVPLKRESGDIQAIRTALKILKKDPLVLFPQGEVGASMDKVNPGVGFLARRSGAPVIAARIEREDRSFNLFKNLFSPEKIRIVFAPVENISTEDTNENIAKLVMDKIKNI